MMVRDEALVAELLHGLIEAAEAGAAERSLDLILPRLVDSLDGLLAPISYLDPFDSLDLYRGSDQPTEAYLLAVLRILDAWRKQGGELDQISKSLDRLPELLQDRLIAQHLVTAMPAALNRALDFLSRVLTTQIAFPEGLALLRTVIAAEPGAADSLLGVLGDPPSAREVALWDRNQTPPEPWMRAQSWLVAMPDLDTEWRDAIAVFDRRYGPAPPDGRPIGEMMSFAGPTSPFEASELAALEPREAAERIAAWRPSSSRDFGPTPRGLERELQQVVKQRPSEWTHRPVEIVTKLSHPTYIYGYFQGLTEVAESVAGQSEDLAEAVLVVSAEPWPVVALHPDEFEADANWDAAKEAGVVLLGKLRAAGGQFGASEDDVRKMLFEAAAPGRDQSRLSGDDTDALTAALNRSSTRALDVAFQFAALTSNGSPANDLDPGFLSLLDDWLEEPGRSGLQGRAMIATRLGFLRRRAPEWWLERRDRLVGNEAPDELGRSTFDLYVKRGRPVKELLREEEHAYMEALRSERVGALQHLLLGVLWGVPPYEDPRHLVDALAVRDAACVSEAGSLLARIVDDVEDEHVIGRAEDFWRAALGANLPTVAYPGFGWFALVERVGAEEWLDLMSRTLELSDGSIADAHGVAERAARHCQDPRALAILTALVASDAPLWEVAQIAEAAVGAVRGARAQGTEPAAVTGLTDALLQRGYYEVKGPFAPN